MPQAALTQGVVMQAMRKGITDLIDLLGPGGKAEATLTLPINSGNPFSQGTTAQPASSTKHLCRWSMDPLARHKKLPVQQKVLLREPLHRQNQHACPAGESHQMAVPTFPVNS